MRYSDLDFNSLSNEGNQIIAFTEKFLKSSGIVSNPSKNDILFVSSYVSIMYCNADLHCDIIDNLDISYWISDATIEIICGLLGIKDNKSYDYIPDVTYGKEVSKFLWSIITADKYANDCIDIMYSLKFD